jgi:hypothetical protein
MNEPADGIPRMISQSGANELTPKGNSPSFWLGVGLMAASFGIYLCYPAIPFLPISLAAKVGLGVVGSVVSWSIFFVGSLLAGREGRIYLRRLFGLRS